MSTAFADTRQRTIRRAARLLLGIYLVAALWVFLGKGITYPDHEGPTVRLNALGAYKGQVNLLPGKTILYYMSLQEGLANCLFNIGGNLLGFFPLGFLLPLCGSGFRRPWRLGLLAIGFSAGIEAVQLLTRTGDCDIDDVLLNGAGALLGLWLLRSLQRRFPGFRTGLETDLSC